VCSSDLPKTPKPQNPLFLLIRVKFKLNEYTMNSQHEEPDDDMGDTDEGLANHNPTTENGNLVSGGVQQAERSIVIKPLHSEFFTKSKDSDTHSKEASGEAALSVSLTNCKSHSAFQTVSARGGDHKENRANYKRAYEQVIKVMIILCSS